MNNWERLIDQAKEIGRLQAKVHQLKGQLAEQQWVVEHYLRSMRYDLAQERARTRWPWQVSKTPAISTVIFDVDALVHGDGASDDEEAAPEPEPPRQTWWQWFNWR